MGTRMQSVLCRLAVSLAMLGTACAVSSPATAMDLVGYNHTNQYVAMYVVNGYPGGDILRHAGGGSFVCCIFVPREWQPGMTVTVKWTEDRNASPISWRTRVVEVPPYKPEDMGRFAVHFFPNDEVKVLVTTIRPGHPDYPYPSPREGKDK
ncbi:DUF3304 domain-containing protein [Cupriavidus sp. 2MCAB6]|uniref:DUF3304 domain-containing protein n=1 Tax=Cupriavidus sp. 2MCAB6 TaxID=3232981 RepID=UPI003F913F8B